MELTELLWSEIRVVWLDYRRLSPQDALEPGLSGAVLAELSLDYDIPELRFHAGHFFSCLIKITLLRSTCGGV